MLFPRWTNRAPLYVNGGLLVIVVLAISALGYILSPSTTQVGYAPKQPVPYSHKLHAGDLGIDCRYCHVGVFTGPVAVVPPTETCMNCHATILPESEALRPIRDSYATGAPMEWIRVHRLPDFAYFDHSAHVNAGVGCESCHGRIDQMITVSQSKPLNMAWCLECHRAPQNALRPVSEVTTMGYVPPGGDQLALGLHLKEAGGIAPPENCSGCHR